MKFKYQRLMLKTAFIYLLIGMLLGLLMYLSPVLPNAPYLLLRTTHVHLILVGAVMQIIMGVALWMFPREKAPPHFTSEKSGMILYFVFNAGTLIRAVCEPFAAPGEILYFTALVGILLQLGGIGFFVTLIFRRIRVPGGE